MQSLPLEATKTSFVQQFLCVNEIVYHFNCNGGKFYWFVPSEREGLKEHVRA